MASVSRLTAEKNARAVHEIALLPGNDRCADCKTRNPRWASHNLGIFICVNCASIHRKIGTHISKVKSLTLDSWSKEQVDNMRNIGNVKSNQYYNPDEVRHPPPTNLVDSERDGELEKFIRNKYEFKRFIDKSAVVQQHLGPSRSVAALRDHPPTRSVTAPLLPPDRSAPIAVASTLNSQPLPPSRPLVSNVTPPHRSATNPFPSVQSHIPAVAPQAPPPAPAGSTTSGGTWSDLISLENPQIPAVSASLPLQYASTPSHQIPFSSQLTNLSSTSYLGADISRASPNLPAVVNPSPNLGVNTSARVAPSPSPSIVPVSGGYTAVSSQPQVNFSNPFSQILSQQHQAQQQQLQQPFLAPSTITNPFPRQASPFQQQQFPTQQGLPLMQPSFYSSQFSANQTALSSFSSPHPSFYHGHPAATSPAMVPQVLSTPGGSISGNSPSTQPQSQPLQPTNPFTSWLTQPAAPAQNGYNAGQWGTR